MAQQTAVEFLINHMLENFRLTDYTVMVVFDQAKQMEKEQIENAHLTGLIRPLEIEATKQAEQYYNETYGTRLQNETN